MKRILSILFMSCLIFASLPVPTYANEAFSSISSNPLESDSIANSTTMSYMRNAIGDDTLKEVASQYLKEYDSEKASLMFKEALTRTYQEVQANQFNQDQAKQLFLAESSLENGTGEISEMTYSKTPPSFAPSHPNTLKLSAKNISDIQLLSNTDRSSRTSYETTGVGYEVQSFAGYNKTTSYLYAGYSNISLKSGKAGYMFYTLSHNNNYQDIGIGFFEGKWHAIVSGHWTGWGVGTINVTQGQKLYFKIWLDGNNYINFQILDGNNFNNIIFSNKYTTWNTVPSNGSGVTFNRQITLVDDAHNPNSGSYLRYANFNQSYIYNSSGYSIFKDSNTYPSRRGKFGCSWASDDTVLINSNTHWDSENISINF